MGRKKFDKGSGQKFYLMHRSLTDQAHAQEGVPSDFVLVPANEAARSAALMTEGTGDASLRKSNIRRPQESSSEQAPIVSFRERKDHVNELGLPNDGYNYEQHLKPIGGGRFISADGKETAYSIPAAPVHLPEDVLASDKMLERDLQAITIDADCMDEDLKAALFDGYDSQGEFEELADDFVAQVMTETEEPDFDFDAHIASLIAKSENKLGITSKARGWEGGMPQFYRKDGDRGAYGEDEEGDWEDEGDWEEDGEGVEGGMAPTLLDVEREALEKQFEKLWGKEYAKDSDAEDDEEEEDNDEEAADDEEDEEFEDNEGDEVNDAVGTLSLEDEALQAALDEFLDQQKEGVLAKGKLVRKGARDFVLVREGAEVPPVDPSHYGQGGARSQREADDVATGQPQAQKGFKEGYEEQLQEQEAWAEFIEELNNGAMGVGVGERGEYDVLTQEYLMEKQEEEGWDCESILSTYSTLYNNPTALPRRGGKKNKNSSSSEAGGSVRGEGSIFGGSVRGGSSRGGRSVGMLVGGRVLRGEALEGYREYLNEVGGAPLPLPPKPAPTPQSLPQQIVLGGRLSLPMSFDKSSSSKVGKTLALGAVAEGEEEEDSEDEGLEEEEEDEDDNSEEDKEGDRGYTDDRKVKGGKRKETAEEKKLRKAQQKAAKREKRELKKGLKLKFKEEKGRMIRQVGAEQGIERRGVFKY